MADHFLFLVNGMVHVSWSCSRCARHCQSMARAGRPHSIDRLPRHLSAEAQRWSSPVNTHIAGTARQRGSYPSVCKRSHKGEPRTSAHSISSFSLKSLFSQPNLFPATVAPYLVHAARRPMLDRRQARWEHRDARLCVRDRTLAKATATWSVVPHR